MRKPELPLRIINTPDYGPLLCPPTATGLMITELQWVAHAASHYNELEEKLLDRTVALHLAIGLAQNEKLPSLEQINTMRRACGWHELVRADELNFGLFAATAAPASQTEQHEQ